MGLRSGGRISLTPTTSTSLVREPDVVNPLDTALAQAISDTKRLSVIDSSSELIDVSEFERFHPDLKNYGPDILNLNKQRQTKTAEFNRLASEFDLLQNTMNDLDYFSSHLNQYLFSKERYGTSPMFNFTFWEYKELSYSPIWVSHINRWHNIRYTSAGSKYASAVNTYHSFTAENEDAYANAKLVAYADNLNKNVPTLMIKVAAKLNFHLIREMMNYMPVKHAVPAGSRFSVPQAQIYNTSFHNTLSKKQGQRWSPDAKHLSQVMANYIRRYGIETMYYGYYREQFLFVKPSNLAKLPAFMSAVITSYANGLTKKIKEIQRLQKIKVDEIKKINGEIERVTVVMNSRDNFNKNINDPIFENFPTIEELEDISNEYNTTMTIAFKRFAASRGYFSIHFPYPSFVVDWVLHRAAIDGVKNFHTLDAKSKKRYLVTSTANISEKFYGNDELIKTIEYRVKLFRKFTKTIESIDYTIANAKINRIIEAVKKGQIVTEETIGGLSQYMHGFGKVVDHDSEMIMDDETMGFTLNFPTITLPQITIAMPKLYDIMGGLGNVIGVDINNIANLYKAVGIDLRGEMYIPVISEVVAAPENIYRETRKFSGDVVAVAVGVVDSAAYAVLPPDIARKIDKITDIPTKAVRGTLTVEDLKEAGQAALKLAIAPAAFVGKITADIVDSAIENVPLVADLDKYSGGLLSSGSRISRVTSTEYEGKGHDPRLLLDALKVGLAVMAAGSISSMLTNTAESAATAAVVDKTGVGGESAAAIIGLYQTGDVTQVAKDVAVSEGTKTAAKTVAVSTGLPIGDVLAVGMGVQQGKPVSQALTDAGKAKAKQSINTEVKKKTGLPVSITEIVNSDPSNKKSLVQEVQTYAKDPATLKELMVAETKLSVKRERENMEKNVDKVVALKDNIANFSPAKETAVLQANANKEIDKRNNDLNRVSKEIDDFSMDDKKEELAANARAEKDRFTKHLYEEMYGLKDKYYPDALLAYLMYQFGPKPSYDKELATVTPQQWEAFQPPADGTLFKVDPNKKKMGTGLKVAGGVILAVASYKIMED